MSSYRAARQFPRFAIDAAVEVVVAGDVRARGRTRDLSRGGLSAAVGVATDEDLPRGARVDVRIALRLEAGHTSEPLLLPARVVWSTPLAGARQLGLAFLPLTRDQLADLELFVRFLDDGRDEGGPDGDASSRFDV
ncbi:MAG TPA: PilZ domain-containing protein [Kofleriaceae bacterium]|nr:PilZ domain-containing protein [Kofleriaceae bacterium]